MKILLALASLIAMTSSAMASSRYLYFVIDENYGKSHVYNLEMDSLYNFVTKYTDGRGSGELACSYKSTAGDLNTFSITWEECDHTTGMNLQLSMGDVTANHDAAFIDHKSVNMSGSISGKAGSLQMAVMSATQYLKVQKGSIHDPNPLPAIESVQAVIRDDRMDSAHQAPGVVSCSLNFVQQGCQQ